MPDNTTTATQDQVIGSIRSAQDATVNAFRSWAKTFTTVAPTMFDTLPSKFDNLFGYVDKMWATQRDFVVNLFEAGAEMGQALPDTAKRAAAAAAESARPAAPKS